MLKIKESLSKQNKKVDDVEMNVSRSSGGNDSGGEKKHVIIYIYVHSYLS